MSSLRRTIALIGMMGVGKSSLGRRLATRLKVPFRDSDTEIELAAGCTITEIFERYGEEAFRSCERKVIARLLKLPPLVLATGGGSFADSQIRTAIQKGAVSVWIKAPVALLIERVGRRDTRPMLRNGDTYDILTRLLDARAPLYGEADIHVETEDGPHQVQVNRILAALVARGIVENM